MDKTASDIEDQFLDQFDEEAFNAAITCRFMSIRDDRLEYSDAIEYFVQLDFKPRFIAVLDSDIDDAQPFFTSDPKWIHEGGDDDADHRVDTAYIKWIDARPSEPKAINDLIEVMWDIWFKQSGQDDMGVDPKPPPGFRIFR